MATVPLLRQAAAAVACGWTLSLRPMVLACVQWSFGHVVYAV